MQACGPAAYVAGLVGKEARWRDTVLEVWEAMPSSEPAGWLPNACVYFCSCFCSCLLIFYVTSAAICAQHFVFVLAAMFTMNFAAREAVAMRRRLAAREIRILVRLAPLGRCQLRVPRGYTILRIIDVLSTCPSVACARCCCRSCRVQRASASGRPHVSRLQHHRRVHCECRAACDSLSRPARDRIAARARAAHPTQHPECYERQSESAAVIQAWFRGEARGLSQQRGLRRC